MSSTSPQTAAELREKIYAKQPVFASIMQQHGQRTLYEYVGQLFASTSIPASERRVEAVQVIGGIVSNRLGAQLGSEVVAQLSTHPVLSTTDHHSWLQDPFWLNANLLYALGVEAAGKPALRHNIVLSFSSISLNNKDGYPRGTVFHDEAGKRMHRPAFFAGHAKQACVYAAPGMSVVNVEHWLHNMHELGRQGGVRPAEAEMLEQMVVSAFDDAVLGKKTLAEQITVFNSQIWKKMSGAKSELIYIEIESVVRELVLKQLGDTGSLIYKVLFDETVSKLAHEAFTGKRGGFDETKKTGTYYFWGIDEEHRRQPLFLHDGLLESSHGSIKTPWNAESVVGALKNGTLMPGMLLSYLIISLYYGFTCFGGFCQVDDLSAIKKAWEGILEATGEQEELAYVRKVNTTAFLGDVALLRLPDGEPATLWDVALYDIDMNQGAFLELAKGKTLNQATEPMLDSMYHVIV